MDILLIPEEISRYSRNISLPQVGLHGQKKLKAASVLIVGLGGLGSPAAIYLAAAGVGHLGLVDGDLVESSNLQRQIIHSTAAIGQPKTKSALAHLRQLNPHIHLDTYQEHLTRENALELIKPYQIILDATDNIPSRYLLNDACHLTNKPLVHGSVYHFEGQVSIFDTNRGACYRCAFPAPPADRINPEARGDGVLGVLPGMIGIIQATETIKLCLGIEPSLVGVLLIYDALQLSFQKIQLHKNPACPLCGMKPTITSLDDATYHDPRKIKE